MISIIVLHSILFYRIIKKMNYIGFTMIPLLFLQTLTVT